VRLVQVIIPTGKREAVLGLLDEKGIDYVLTDETSGREYTGVAYFPLPTSAVEPVLTDLREQGLNDRAYTVVLDAETVVSRQFEELQERYEEEEEADERIAREELTATATDLAPAIGIYVAMTIISAVVATAGLLLDSPAVVVGSMVIAPLIGPAMATAVGTVVDDQELFVRGVRLQAIGFTLTVAAATAFALLVKELHLVQFVGSDIAEIGQIRERLAPDVLSLAVALGAGAAGAVSLSSGVSASLVGVMIAVALVPPAATVGIGIAWQLPMLVLGAGVLGLVNMLSINLAGISVLWYSGYRPESWFRLDEARTATVTRVAVLAAAIAVLSVFLGGVTYDSYQAATTEDQIRATVDDALTGTGAELFDLRIVRTNGILFRHPEQVVVTVGVPPGDRPPDLAGRVDARVQRATDHDVAVQVRYVEFEETGTLDRSTSLRSGERRPRVATRGLGVRESQIPV
jgi:uncharacterized hydrophobic protein (TIGR00341 family)